MQSLVEFAMSVYRILLRLLVLVNLLAFATIALPSPTTAASSRTIRSWYFQSMTQEERMHLQIHLILTSDYDGVIDGDIGNRSIRSILRYQKALGANPTGMLTDKQLAQLKYDANTVFDKLNIRNHYDARAGFDLFLPLAYLDEYQDTRRGTRFYSLLRDFEVETIRIDRPKRSLKQVYDRMVSLSGRQVTYSTFHGNWFVVTGVEQSRKFYSRFYTNGLDQRGFSVAYENRLDQIMSPVVILMSNAFSPYSNRKGSVRSAPKQASTLEDRRPSQSQAEPSQEKEGPSSGTGFFVSDEGYIATNAHVVNGCSRLDVDGWGTPKVIEIDETNDLAVLQVKKEKRQIHSLKLNISGAKLGEDILALGYPLRGLLSENSSDLSVTTGVVSTLAGLQGDRRYLTISAPVQPGNSGGPLVNRSGEVVGIVSAKLNALRMMILTGDVPQNVNFAVKSQLLAGHLLIAGLSQSDYESRGAEKFNETAELVSSLKSSIVAISCTP